MAFVNPTTPNLTDYTTFLRNLGWDTTVLPDASDWITISYDVALEIVNPDIGTVSGRMYTLAVYNYGADRIINFAPDQTGQSFFAGLRTDYHISDPSTGLVSSASDEGTSSSLVTPETFKDFTTDELQLYKTPQGRYYLNIAQMYGNTLWGLT